jgi:hypothetical protein
VRAPLTLTAAALFAFACAHEAKKPQARRAVNCPNETLTYVHNGDAPGGGVVMPVGKGELATSTIGDCDRKEK